MKYIFRGKCDMFFKYSDLHAYFFNFKHLSDFDEVYHEVYHIYV